MEEINIRFKKLRKNLGLSQESFGKAIGLSKSGISNIEKGVRKVTDKHIKILNHELNVNENWLRNGTPPIFNPTYGEIIDSLAQQYKLDEISKSFIENLLLLNESDMKTLLDISNAMIIKSKVENQKEKYRELLSCNDLEQITANIASINPNIENEINSLNNK